MENNQNLRLEVLSESYIHALVKFLANFDASEDENYWYNRVSHWWEKNPAFSEELVRGWIFIDKKKNNIVGFFGIIPSFFMLNGKKIVANNGTTWRADKRYRSKCITLLLKGIEYSENRVFFNTSPTKRVAEILKALKLQDFSIKEQTVILISSKKFLKGLLNIKFLNKLHIIIDSIMRLYTYIFIRLLIDKKDTSAVRLIIDIESDFDLLWEKTKNKYLNTSVRNKETIKWYYECNNVFKKHIFGYYESNVLETFIITGVNTNDKDIKYLFLVDIWGNKIEKNVLKMLFDYILKFAEKENIDFIVVQDFHDELYDIIKYFSPIRSKGKKRLYKLNGNSSFRGKTYLSMMQGDFGL